MDVINNTAEHRFEIRQGSEVAELVYEERPSVIALVHTEVPPSLEGQGYGAALAKTALDYARDKGLKVMPTCQFVQAYIKRHPEYQSLVA